jgi:DNA-binding transcriptional LysR family regulator
MQNRIEMLRIFCAAVDAGSFKDAAVRLAISPQAVTRAVAEAESLTGEVLFHRNTRRVQVTEAGAAFSDKARELVTQVDELFRAGADTSPLSGLVRLTVPKSLGELVLMPALLKLAVAYPLINIDIRFSDTIVDPIAEKIDIGVRIGFMHDSRFVAREAAQMGFVIVATPELIAREGVPADLAALRRMPTTGLVDKRTGRLWGWQLKGGQEFIPANVTFRTDDAEAECRAVLAGLGISQVASYLVRPLIRAGKLVSVLEEFEPEAWPVCVYRPQRGPVPPRLRVVFDAIVSALEAADLG